MVAWGRGEDVPTSNYTEAVALAVRAEARANGRKGRIDRLQRAADRIPTNPVLARAVAEVIQEALSPEVRVIPTFAPDVVPSEAERAGGAVVVVQTLQSESRPEGPVRGRVLVTAFRPAWAAGMLSPARIEAAAVDFPDVSFGSVGQLATPTANDYESVLLGVEFAVESIPSILHEVSEFHLSQWASGVGTTALSRLSGGASLRLNSATQTWTADVADLGEIVGKVISTSVKDGRRTTIATAKFPLKGQRPGGKYDAAGILPLVIQDMPGKFVPGLGRITNVQVASKSADNAFGWTNCTVTATFVSRID